MQIPLVATNDLHYTSKADAQAHDVLLCIQTGATVDEPDRFRFDGDEFFLKSREEMELALPRSPRRDRPHARRRRDVQRRVAIRRAAAARLRHARREFARRLPDEALLEGAKRRYGDPLPDDAATGSTTSSGSSSEMGFAGYFLIVADVVNWAKGDGIRVGPGRGSAAGSLVSYCLNITSLDPLRYGLVFERFLNPERREMPDIDIDFDDRRRGDVITYLRKKYGERSRRADRHVRAHQGQERHPRRRTGARLPVRTRRPAGEDVPALRPRHRPVAQGLLRAVDGIALEVRVHRGVGDAEGVRGRGRLAQGARRRAEARRAAPADRRPRGRRRGRRDPLVNHTALQRTDNDGVVVTQYEMHAIETSRPAQDGHPGPGEPHRHRRDARAARRGREDRSTSTTLPLDDPTVYELLQRGDSDGVFQMESEGMRRLLKQLRPDNFEDIVALIALYRPGPMARDPEVHRRQAPRRRA